MMCQHSRQNSIRISQLFWVLFRALHQYIPSHPIWCLSIYLVIQVDISSQGSPYGRFRQLWSICKPFRPFSRSQCARIVPRQTHFSQQATMHSCQSRGRDLAGPALYLLRGTNQNLIPIITAKRLEVKRKNWILI